MLFCCLFCFSFPLLLQCFVEGGLLEGFWVSCGSSFFYYLGQMCLFCRVLWGVLFFGFLLAL